MKKFFVLAAIAAATMFSLSSCEKDGDDEGDISGSIEGTWDGVSMKVNIYDKSGNTVSMEEIYRVMLKAEGKSDSEIDAYIAEMKKLGVFEESLGEDELDVRLEFKSNGKVISYAKNEKTGKWEVEDDESTWKLSGNKLTVVSDGTEGSFKVKTLNKSKLVLEVDGEYGADIADSEEFEYFVRLGYTISVILEFKRA